MNISRTTAAFNTQQTRAAVNLQPAAEAELQQVDGFSQTQDRFDGNAFGKAIGGMFGAGVGATGGAIGGAVIAAIADASGWGVVGATVGGAAVGLVAGGYIGSR